MYIAVSTVVIAQIDDKYPFLSSLYFIIAVDNVPYGNCNDVKIINIAAGDE